VADLLALVSVFASLFAIVDPLAAAPVYLSLTRGYSDAEKRHVALKAVLVAAGVLIFFGLAGEQVFRVFGITIPAFRIAGGILIFKYAFDMLHGERPGPDGTHKEIKDAIERESIGITPLGVPLLTGPGAIATVMVFLAGAPDETYRVGVYACIVLIFVISYVMLLSAARFDRLLGPTGLMVTIRLMGLLLAAIAVQFVADGIMGVVDLFLASRDAA
jgi:multiple antibiotic resistance protein